MKSIIKTLILFLATILLLSSSSCESASKKETFNSESLQEKEAIEQENTTFAWTDYIPSASTNVYKVGFCDLTESTPYDLRKLVSTPSENTIGFCARVACPHCKREETVYFDFDQLPQEKLGEKVIVLEEQVTCWSWDEHEDPFTREYPASVLLALNK